MVSIKIQAFDDDMFPKAIYMQERAMVSLSRRYVDLVDG